MNTTVLKNILIAIVIASLAYTTFSYIKGIGYHEAEQKYEKLISDRYNLIGKKIDSIETNSNLLVLKDRQDMVVLTKDIATIMNSIKGKTLTIIKDGKCVPTEEFSNSFRTINIRINQSIKESQK